MRKMPLPAKIYAPVSNYYGAPYVEQVLSGWFFVLECEAKGDDRIEVSEAFFKAFVKEFYTPPSAEEVRELAELARLRAKYPEVK